MKKIRRAGSGLAFRIICSIVVLMLIFGTVSSALGYVLFTDSLTEEYNESAFRTAETAAALVDGAKIDEYLASGGDSEEYRNIISRMDTLCIKQNVTLIYVIDVDRSDYGRFVSVFNSVLPDSGYSPWEAGYQRDTTNDEYREIYREIYENGLKRGTVVRDSGLNGKAPHITSLVPISKEDGTVTAILCVQRPMAELDEIRLHYLKGLALTTLVLCIVAIVSSSSFLRRQFVIPVKAISREADRFARENSKGEDGCLDGISNIREISQLADSLEKMEEDTVANMELMSRISADRARISTELNLASRIQANMLPNIFPPFPEREEFEIYASMRSAKEVGGDFYDFFLIDEDHLGLVMADVSGKGVPAALFMMIAKLQINNLAEPGVSPGEVLNRLNNLICRKNDDVMFVTVWFSIYSISTGRLVAANAGHEYPVLRKNGGSYEILKDKHGLVIGAMAGMKYREYELQLEPGDSLFIYTDGIPEATDANNELFGTERMLGALNKEPDAPVEKLLDIVKNEVESFVGDAPQFDDMTMLALKRH